MKIFVLPTSIWSDDSLHIFYLKHFLCDIWINI